MKHANDNKGQGIRANSGKSEGGNLELTSCTHTQEEKELVPVSSHATLRYEVCKTHIQYKTLSALLRGTGRRKGWRGLTVCTKKEGSHERLRDIADMIIRCTTDF